MPEFRVIKRSDVPRAAVKAMPGPASARLTKIGTIAFSALATEALGTENCRLMAEFDEDARILKFTVAPDQLPRGITPEDCFLLRVRPAGRRFIAQMSVIALFSYIGFKSNGNGSRALEIVALDPERHSISLLLPPCENSSH